MKNTIFVEHLGSTSYSWYYDNIRFTTAKTIDDYVEAIRNLMAFCIHHCFPYATDADSLDEMIYSVIPKNLPSNIVSKLPDICNAVLLDFKIKDDIIIIVPNHHPTFVEYTPHYFKGVDKNECYLANPCSKYRTSIDISIVLNKLFGNINLTKVLISSISEYAALTEKEKAEIQFMKILPSSAQLNKNLIKIIDYELMTLNWLPKTEDYEIIDSIAAPTNFQELITESNKPVEEIYEPNIPLINPHLVNKQVITTVKDDTPAFNIDNDTKTAIPSTKFDETPKVVAETDHGLDQSTATDTISTPPTDISTHKEDDHENINETPTTSNIVRAFTTKVPTWNPIDEFLALLDIDNDINIHNRILNPEKYEACLVSELVKQAKENNLLVIGSDLYMTRKFINMISTYKNHGAYSIIYYGLKDKGSMYCDEMLEKLLEANAISIEHTTLQSIIFRNFANMKGFYGISADIIDKCICFINSYEFISYDTMTKFVASNDCSAIADDTLTCIIALLVAVAPYYTVDAKFDINLVQLACEFEYVIYPVRDRGDWIEFKYDHGETDQMITIPECNDRSAYVSRQLDSENNKSINNCKNFVYFSNDVISHLNLSLHYGHRLSIHTNSEILNEHSLIMNDLMRYEFRYWLLMCGSKLTKKRLMNRLAAITLTAFINDFMCYKDKIHVTCTALDRIYTLPGTYWSNKARRRVLQGVCDRLLINSTVLHSSLKDIFK